MKYTVCIYNFKSKSVLSVQSSFTPASTMIIHSIDIHKVSGVYNPTNIWTIPGTCMVMIAFILRIYNLNLTIPVIHTFYCFA